jgi:hypothetical protein
MTGLSTGRNHLKRVSTRACEVVLDDDCQDSLLACGVPVEEDKQAPPFIERSRLLGQDLAPVHLVVQVTHELNRPDPLQQRTRMPGLR